MNKVYLAVMLACWGSAAMAAEQVEVNQVSDLTGAVSGAAKIGALGAGDGEFRKVRAVTLPNGQQRIRYEQTWQGIPVWGQVLVADQALGGQPGQSGVRHHAAQDRCRPDGPGRCPLRQRRRTPGSQRCQGEQRTGQAVRDAG